MQISNNNQFQKESVMKSVLRIPFVIALLFAVLLSACGAPQPQIAIDAQSQQSESVQNPIEKAQPAPAQGIDACALFTKADAESILGQPVGEPEFPIQGSATFNVTSCKYRLQNDRFTSASLIVTVPVNGNVQSAQTAYNTDKSQVQEMYSVAPVDVPGLGDNAYWAGGSGNHLAILAGNVHLIIRADGLSGDVPPQPLVDLAGKMLSQLQ